MGDTPPNDESDPQQSNKWSWFIDECTNDLERRRDVYSFGETVKCKELCGIETIIIDKNESQYENFANICLFLPRPLPDDLGPLDNYVSKVRTMLLERKAIPEGNWIGFDAGPFPLPFYPWSYSSELPDLERRTFDLRTRIQEENERIERPNRHFERRLNNYFSGTGIEPALTLAIASYLSNFCLPNLDVFHLYTALLFSGDILKTFEKSFSQANKAIKDEIINHLKDVIARKETLLLLHPFESQALELIQSRTMEEIFLYVYQYGNYTDLRCFIDEELASGPHFFFKFMWKGIPFNKLFLGFLKLKPADLSSFTCDLVLNKEPTCRIPTSYFSELHMHGIPSYKQPEFFKEHWPIRRGYRFDSSLIEGKVLSFKSSLAPPNRELSWEEEILLTCSTPKNLKLKLIEDWDEYLEFEQINSTQEPNETSIQHIPHEGMGLWENCVSETTKNTEKLESLEETIDITKQISVNRSSTSTDLFCYTSVPLDAKSKLRQSSTLSNASNGMLDEIEIWRDIEDLVIALEGLADLEDSDFLIDEIYSGDIFEEEEEEEQEQEEQEQEQEQEGEEEEEEEDLQAEQREILLDWTEDNLMIVEEIRSELSSWNPYWKLRPFCVKSSEKNSTTYEEDENSEEFSDNIEFIEPALPEIQPKHFLKQRGWSNECKEPPYWLRTIWKKIMWINWRGKNRLWIIDTLNKIEYLILRKNIMEDISLEIKKYNLYEVSDDSDQDLETSSNSSLISENNSSSENLEIPSTFESLELLEPSTPSTEYGSSFSSVSLTDCKYIESAFRAQSPWEFHSTEPLSLHLEKSVTFFEMCARVLRQKEEILQHAIEMEALSVAPPKLYLSRQIQRSVRLFLNLEMNISNRLSEEPSSSFISLVSHKSTRSRLTGGLFRGSTKRSYISKNYKDLGDWLHNLEAQIHQSNVQTHTRLLAYLRNLDNFKRLILNKFLSEVSSLGDITDSFRWKLSIKRPIRCQRVLINLCCRLGPIRNTTFLCDLLVQSESLRILIMSKLTARKMRHQISVRTTSSALAYNDSSDSEIYSVVEEILFHEDDIIKKWPRKKEWPSKEDNEENLQRHWLDKKLFETWKIGYSPQNMAKRLLVLWGLRNLRQKKITARHHRADKHNLLQ
ncbi:unnamed protein product [Nezara viridula]|uniref:Uncharacterized protein n=1 Tax=Nezara viridula TaxID=85310 RepID=A0A9P0E6W3_NEZVI|nr:unnamed protein product [Nezara viridula]